MIYLGGRFMGFVSELADRGERSAPHEAATRVAEGVRLTGGQQAAIRTFGTGATRDTAEGKNDYEGFLSPLVLEAYGDYMTTHRKQSDGSLRGSDNWQLGIDITVYRSSLIRHVMTAWSLWRGWPVKAEMIGGIMRKPTLVEALCGVLFNTMGMLHEMLKQQRDRC